MNMFRTFLERLSLRQSLATWLGAILLSACIWPQRCIFLKGLDGAIPTGFMPLSEPTDGCHLHLWLFYRVMHNLTTPYFIAFYIAGFAALFFYFRTKGRRWFMPLCASIHYLFLLGFLFSLLTPLDWVFSVSINNTR